MKSLKIILADNSYIARKGLVHLISEVKDFQVVAEVESKEDLIKQVLLKKPDVLIIDYHCSCFSVDELAIVSKKSPNTHILAITCDLPVFEMKKAFELGALSHLLKDCGREEIIEAIYETSKGNKFLCGKIVDKMLNPLNDTTPDTRSTSCEGMNITEREMEIIRLVAEGLSNKEVADKLFLSVHTVTTHRKNIMAKLGVSNTAGLVMFAIREKLISPNKFLFSANN